MSSQHPSKRRRTSDSKSDEDSEDTQIQPKTDNDWAIHLRQIPVLIFCAKQEELSLALEAFKLESDLCHFDQESYVDAYGTPFYCGYFESKTDGRQLGKVEFYIVSGPGQGPESAAAAASHIMTLYQPKFAMSIGICGGITGQVDIMDVLFACSAVNYEAGKRNTNSEDAKLENDFSAFEMDLNLVKVNDGVKRQVISLIKNDSGRIWKEGCMITGSAVRKDVKSLILTLGHRLPRDIKGLDMEASAFFTACRICQVTALPVIKGISDMGDGNKSDDTHRLCIRRAVIAGLKFLKQYFGNQQGQQYWKKNQRARDPLT